MIKTLPSIHFTILTAFIWCFACSGGGAVSGDGGDDPNGTDDEIVGDARFQVNASLSPVISTVGIVTWSVDKTPDSATIDFGLDTDYGFTAPVDLNETEYRTLLLGMKPNTTVHFRVSAKSAGVTYRSDDYTVETGSLPTGLPAITVNTLNATALQGGFWVICSFGGDYAFVLDADGDYVWWYNPEGNINDWVRARLSSDGKSMLIANGNVPGPSNGTLVKVSLDGLDETIYPLTARHHDVTVLPDSDVITYFEYETTGTGTCDRLMEMSPDGSSREVFKIRDHFADRASQGEWCHANAVNYVPSEDAYYLSVLNFNSILKIDRTTGALLWVLGGDDSDFPGVTWEAQHQHQTLDGGILIFNNRGDGSGAGFNTPSRVLEFALDESQMTATEKWVYTSGSLNSMSMGDAKRLPNGNTIVVYSTSGTAQEVDQGGDLLREIIWGMGGALGYVEWRTSLYGPPQEYL